MITEPSIPDITQEDDVEEEAQNEDNETARDGTPATEISPSASPTATDAGEGKHIQQHIL